MEVEVKEFGVRIRLIVEPYTPVDEPEEPKCVGNEHVMAAHACIMCQKLICPNCAEEHRVDSCVPSDDDDDPSLYDNSDEDAWESMGEDLMDHYPGDSHGEYKSKD